MYTTSRKKKLIEYITQEEFERIYNYVVKLEHDATVKRKQKLKQYRVAILLGFESGMRISEIIGLKYSKSAEFKIKPLTKEQFENNSIKIIGGKGDKDRKVPKPKRINTTAIHMLPLKIKRRSLQKFIADIGKIVLKKHITFHTLRHGFGSHLANKRPLHELQMLMGHSRLDTTGAYLHANPAKAIEGAIEAF